MHVIEGVIYVKDARPYFLNQLVDLPIQSLSIHWITVDSDCKKPRITDQVLYETALDGAQQSGCNAPSSRYNLQELSVIRGLYTARKWEWVPPGSVGTCRGGGWIMRFWVPMPLAFLQCRAGGVASFVYASVSLVDEDQDDFLRLHAQTTVTVETLSRGRDMPLFSRL